MSASAAKSTESSSLLDFLFVSSFTWQTGEVLWGSPATELWLFVHTRAQVEGKAGCVARQGRKEVSGLTSPEDNMSQL